MRWRFGNFSLNHINVVLTEDRFVGWLDRTGYIAVYLDLTRLDNFVADTNQAIGGSRTLVPDVLTNGTNLDEPHLGKSLRVNGGTINLPLDANWEIGDEFEFIQTGTTATTIQWAGQTIRKRNASGATITIPGVECNVVIVKKMAAGIAYAFGDV